MANLRHNDLYTQFYNNLINGNSITNIDVLLKDCNFIKYNSDIKETQCPISLEEFKDGDSLIELPCNHIFLEKHIKNWLKEKTSCPMCRHNLDSKSSKGSDHSMRQGQITNQIDTMITYLTNQLLNSENEYDDTIEPIFEIY